MKYCRLCIAQCAALRNGILFLKTRSWLSAGRFPARSKPGVRMINCTYGHEEKYKEEKYQEVQGPR
jgi:hypothetical protein